MIHSRRGRGLALGAGVLAAGAIALAAAPTAMAAETPNASTPTTATAAGQGARPGPKPDGPYVGARLVPTKDGATVARVVDGSPADTAGLVEGDVVKSVDGVAVDHRGALREALSAAKAGDEITVVVDHNSAQETVVITLGAQGDRPAPPAPADVAWAGARLAHFEKKDGVLVRSVAADGPAATAGIAAGDVVTSIDGQTVTDWWQAREIVASHAPGDKIQVVVDRDGASRTLTVTLGSLDEAPARSHANGSKTAAVGA
ncbi:PDZ domain-containing protein [Demequina lutea]|uniref:S1-C subfamily serine protease n=1 Tax=Demequina lutea TaxID=431489 RepID=A0A7Z0CIA9_9MICO|nr:PDZ domain-containing protein [Demequina lutea]NYI42376.1 S1-C subfamily serine protease [Demequina lutea]